MDNGCGRQFTLQVGKGEEAIMLNNTGNSHEDHGNLNEMKMSYLFASFAYGGDNSVQRCAFTITVYPTMQMKEHYNSKQPLFYAMTVFIVFLVTIFSFLIFDSIRRQQHNSILKTAQKQNMIVKSLFPQQIQDQLMQELDNNEKARRGGSKQNNKSGTAGLRSYLNDRVGNECIDIRDGKASKPIADLFPDTTIMFADIVGMYFRLLFKMFFRSSDKHHFLPPLL
jgi:hypothetical protein